MSFDAGTIDDHEYAWFLTDDGDDLCWECLLEHREQVEESTRTEHHDGWCIMATIPSDATGLVCCVCGREGES